MAHQTEHSDQGHSLHTDQDRTLPQPELNPLLNPLLGQHMGRWAEVYFTAAPENRDEAVLALLRQLESEASSEPQASVAEPRVAADAGKATYDPSPIAPKPAWIQTFDQTSLTCESCGKRVPKTQRFCGMCGARLRAGHPGENVLYDDIDDIDTSNGESASEFYPEDMADQQDTVFSFGGNVSSADDPVPYRYRVYVGAALVILIAVLAIMAYRSAQSWLGTSRALPQATPAAQTQPATPPPSKADTSDRNAKSENENAVVPRDSDAGVAPKTESSVPHTRAAAMHAAAPVNAAPVAASNPTSTSAGQGNGVEELSVAERYLNGGHGNARDSGEAARWLWQAVAKKNAAAALLLSDLYLRGDGVPKNCDQARLLLDAAAQKGVSAAGDRLRNLQAFGCQ